ncbi:uncharacterized protein LOC126689834 [Quercus robur]|uniref:uncharacterized protein LOC126689834 n=1 Tax=Quercus robur TaxID=38942 RepID=UPI0021617184|nr:uncharacterized protein LOC126689834 [Quercus robur]
MVSELPNSSMAFNVAVDSETLPTDPLPSTNSSTDPSMTADRRSNSNSSMDDQNSNPSSPYFLPPSDNSVILVSQPLTSLENYLSWSRVVFLSLSGRNKFGFVNGQMISMPDPSSSLYNAWHRSNTTILSWLVNSLSKELQSSVMYIHIARDLWIDMHDGFSQPNAPRFFEVHKEISKLSQG